MITTPLTEAEARLNEIAFALVGGRFCNVCHTTGEGCTQEHQCHFLRKIRSPGNDSVIDVFRAKELALEWQEKQYA